MSLQWSIVGFVFICFNLFIGNCLEPLKYVICMISSVYWCTIYVAKETVSDRLFFSPSIFIYLMSMIIVVICFHIKTSYFIYEMHTLYSSWDVYYGWWLIHVNKCLKQIFFVLHTDDTVSLQQDNDFALLTLYVNNYVTNPYKWNTWSLYCKRSPVSVQNLMGCTLHHTQDMTL